MSIKGVEATTRQAASRTNLLVLSPLGTHTESSPPQSTIRQRLNLRTYRDTLGITG